MRGGWAEALEAEGSSEEGRGKGGGCKVAEAAKRLREERLHTSAWGEPLLPLLARGGQGGFGLPCVSATRQVDQDPACLPAADPSKKAVTCVREK